MRNLLIVWSDKSKIGVPILDEHHRGIVSVINSLFYYMSHPASKSVLMAHLGMIEQYGRIHFLVEEELLEKAGYPELETHKAQHEDLTRKTHIIAMECRRTGDPQALLQFLKTWWIEHINVDDKACEPCLNDYMNTQP